MRARVLLVALALTAVVPFLGRLGPDEWGVALPGAEFEAARAAGEGARCRPARHNGTIDVCARGLRLRAAAAGSATTPARPLRQKQCTPW